jgi:predicted amidohydrolase
MSSSLPRDPADLFSELYDRLPSRPFAGDEANRWYEDRDLTARAFEIRDHVLATGTASEALLAELEGGADDMRFTAMRGLDAALEHVNPFSGVHDPGRLNGIARRYARTGRLNEQATGALLVRCCFAGRPPGVPDKPDFFSLMRVSQAVWKDIDHARIENESDVTLEPPSKGRMIHVGCTPLVGSYEEMQFDKTRRGVRPAYRIAPRAEAVGPRVEAVLDALEVQNATIGVAPEVSLSSELLEVWLDALLDPSRADTPEWILVGTGPVGNLDPPANRAMLLDRGGRPLISQDKRHDFTLTVRQLRRWKLVDQLGGLPRVEDITRGERLQIRESSLGRIAILICEDLTRAEVAGAVIACGVSHIFVPIFSQPVRHLSAKSESDSWVIHSAAKHASEVGAWLIIATSLAIGRAIDPSVRPSATSAVVGPRENRDDWVPEVRYGEATQPEDVCLFRIPPALTRRFSDFS